MSNEWRQHPKLRNRFHPDAPDDLQVIVHDGGPRLSANSPELIWVTLTSVDGHDVFTGRVLNQPQNLKSISLGTIIKFVAPAGDYLVMVTEKYLAERDRWSIHGCNKCGFDELFDAPSDLIRAIFPDIAADTSMEMFTSFCGICGGVQGIQDKNSLSFESAAIPEANPRKWWQFWR